MIPVADPFMAGIRPSGLQKGRGGFLRSADDAPYVSDPVAMTNHDGNKPDLIALCIERGIAVPAKVTVAQLHEMLGQRPCRVKYGSPSNAGLLVEPEGGLLKHKQRYSVLGFGLDPSLAESCKQLIGLDFDSQEYRNIADGIMARAERVADGMLAADRGTHGHLICELIDTASDWPSIIEAGEALGLSTDTQIAVALSWGQMLAANGLEILAIEASCVDDKWRLAGTLDRIVRTTKPLTFVKPGGELVTIPADTVLILDIKFGKCRKAHPIQIASYAQSVPYDTTTEVRGEWPWAVNQTHALIAHGDFGDDTRPVTIELVWVDLVAGREHGGQCVVDAKAWAARSDVFSVAQIVEGGAEPMAPVIPSPSTLSPVPLPAAGEGAVDSVATPSPATLIVEGEADKVPDSPAQSLDATIGHGYRPIDTGGASPSTWPLADPARLALVDARAALCPSPDEGADWSSDEYKPLWDELRRLFDGLDPVAKAWRSELVSQAMRRNVGFHAQGGMTERRFDLNRAIIALALAGDGDDILRELLAGVVGDVALFPAIEPGHVIGSLTADEACRFAAHVDAYLSVPVGAA